LDLKIGNTRHAQEALQFQSEGATHLNPLDTLAVPHAVRKSKSKVQAMLFSASREALKARLEECAKLEADPDCIGSNGLALVHFLRWKAPALSDAFIVDLGSNEWTASLMCNGELVNSHALGIGTETLLAALWEDRKKILLPKEVEGVAKQIDLAQIKPNLNPHLSAKLSEIRQELGKTIFSFHRIAGELPIVFTGHVDAFGHLKPYLVESFKEAVSKEYDESLDPEELKYAIPIGLALEQAKGEPLQLLSEEFFPKKNWKRAGAYGLSLICLSVCLNCALLSIGFGWLKGLKDRIIGSVEQAIEIWDPQLKNTLQFNEELALDQWIGKVNAHGKEYPYILDVPRAAEVLAWFGQHPLLQEFKAEGDPLELVDLHYQLVEFPTIGSAQRKYQAKAEIQFRAKSPMHARQFHEALLKGDDWVDSSKEIAWEALNDSYRASFFFKRKKEPYVP
jgi:hypothetical protein